MKTSKSFLSFMESVIKCLRQRGSRTTASNYLHTLERLRRFREGKDFSFKEMDYIFVEDYVAHLKKDGLSSNTISFYMRILRAVYNRAVEQGVTNNKKPFRTVFTGTEKTRKRAIRINDLKRIRKLDLSLYPEREFARDVFMFLFFCRGMSFVDAAYLKKSDIKNGVLSYRRRKTNQPLQVKMEREMEEIISRHTLRGSPYLLPLISDFGDAHQQYSAAIHRINNSLKKVGRMLNLPIALTTYVSRHTWATIAKRLNVPLAVISEALGHGSETTTQIYLASIDSSVIDRANSMIIKGL